MPNLLNNGDFSRGLYEWEGSGSIHRALGYPRLNCALLATGQTLSQDKGISEENLYTLHYFYRVASGATLTAGYGDVTQTHTGAPLDVWREGVLVFSVETGEGNDAVEFSASGGNVHLDTVTLLPGGLVLSRAEIASKVAAALAEIATDASLSATASATGPEGDYSAAIDEALRAVGAMNQWGDPDVTLLDAFKANEVLEQVRVGMLQRVRSKYALEVDVSLGPRSESRSQIASSIDEMLAGAGGSRRPTMGKLDHGDWRR